MIFCEVQHFPEDKSTVSARTTQRSSISMAKPQRKIKKANHGRRPANAQARKARRKKLRT
jgi:hypothetical protein